MILARDQVALGILAGGRASRMGGADKALVSFGGERLVDRVLAAVGPGYAASLISYNLASNGHLPRSLLPVADLRAGNPGPLAGIEALLNACEARWLLSLPVDIEKVPPRLFDQFAEFAQDGIGVRARDEEGEQPLVALWPVPEARAAVRAALDAGEGAVHRVQDRLGFRVRELPRLGNLNTPADLHP